MIQAKFLNARVDGGLGARDQFGEARAVGFEDRRFEGPLPFIRWRHRQRICPTAPSAVCWIGASFTGGDGGQMTGLGFTSSHIDENVAHCGKPGVRQRTPATGSFGCGFVPQGLNSLLKE